MACERIFEQAEKRGHGVLYESEIYEKKSRHHLSRETPRWFLVMRREKAEAEMPATKHDR